MWMHLSLHTLAREVGGGGRWSRPEPLTNDLGLCWVIFSKHLLCLFCVTWKLEKTGVVQEGREYQAKPSPSP